MTKSARKLQRVRYIKNNGRPKLSHNGKRSHVNYKVVITKTHTALGQQQFFASRSAGLVYNITRVIRAPSSSIGFCVASTKNGRSKS